MNIIKRTPENQGRWIKRIEIKIVRATHPRTSEIIEQEIAVKIIKPAGRGSSEWTFTEAEDKKLHEQNEDYRLEKERYDEGGFDE